MHNNDDDKLQTKPVKPASEGEQAQIAHGLYSTGYARACDERSYGPATCRECCDELTADDADEADPMLAGLCSDCKRRERAALCSRGER